MVSYIDRRIGVLVPKSFGGRDGQQALEEIASQSEKPAEKTDVSGKMEHVRLDSNKPVKEAVKPWGFWKQLGAYMVVGFGPAAIVIAANAYYTSPEQNNNPTQTYTNSFSKTRGVDLGGIYKAP